MTDSHKPHDARAVANEILRLGQAKQKSFTVMQLIKLVYLAQGWSLALLKRPLVAQTVQAWQYGPVYPHIYKALSRYGSAPVREQIVDKATGLPYDASFDAGDASVIQHVVDQYGTMHAYALSNIMHQPGTPWTTVFEEQGPYKDIPNELIAKHFNEVLNGSAVGA